MYAVLDDIDLSALEGVEIPLPRPRTWHAVAARIMTCMWRMWRAFTEMLAVYAPWLLVLLIRATYGPQPRVVISTDLDSEWRDWRYMYAWAAARSTSCAYLLQHAQLTLPGARFLTFVQQDTVRIIDLRLARDMLADSALPLGMI